MDVQTLRIDLLLLLVAALWGSGFVAQRMGAEHIPAMAFTGLRFSIASFVLIPVVLLVRQFSTRHAKLTSESATGTADSETVIPAATTPFPFAAAGIAGALLSLATGLQQLGLEYTTAGKAGFITGMYVVFIPIFGMFLGHRTRPATWFGVLLAAVGLYYLSVSQSFETINRGDLLVFFCAVVWSFHILLIAWAAPRVDPIAFALLQFSVAAAISLCFALLFEDWTLSGINAGKWAIVYGGAVPIGIAFTLQVFAQSKAPPAHAAVLLSLETVFAAFIGWLLLSEMLKARELVGCTLMLLGMFVSQFRGRCVAQEP